MHEPERDDVIYAYFIIYSVLHNTSELLAESSLFSWRQRVRK
jgi:hypothetical protein